MVQLLTGRCATCRRWTLLTVAGLVRKHIGYTGPRLVCPGSGHPPDLPGRRP